VNLKKKCLKKGGPVEAMKVQWNFYLHETFCPVNQRLSRACIVHLVLVFTFRKGISQHLECDDCASFMSKYSTRNASRIYIVETSEVWNVV
jgi:hypothetical protein